MTRHLLGDPDDPDDAGRPHLGCRCLGERVGVRASGIVPAVRLVAAARPDPPLAYRRAWHPAMVTANLAVSFDLHTGCCERREVGGLDPDRAAALLIRGFRIRVPGGRPAQMATGRTSRFLYSGSKPRRSNSSRPPTSSASTRWRIVPAPRSRRAITAASTSRRRRPSASGTSRRTYDSSTCPTTPGSNPTPGSTRAQTKPCTSGGSTATRQKASRCHAMISSMR